MIIFQWNIQYHPPKELNKQKSNTEQTIKKTTTNKQTNKTEQKKKKMKKKYKKNLNKFVGFAWNSAQNNLCLGTLECIKLP